MHEGGSISSTSCRACGKTRNLEISKGRKVLWKLTCINQLIGDSRSLVESFGW
jgi:hypothetical protein